MNKRFRKIFALIICLIIMATTCAISASAVLINTVTRIKEDLDGAAWKAESTMTQSYIRLSVGYCQIDPNTNDKFTKLYKDTKYNTTSFTLKCSPESGYIFAFRSSNPVANFANGAPGYIESINDEII